MDMQTSRIYRSALPLLPGFGVLVFLGALGVVGYLTDWKLSNFSELWKRTAPAEEAGKAEEKPRDFIAGRSGVRFASAEALAKSALQTAPAERRPVSQSVAANGTVDYDRTRVAQLSTRAPGNVWKVYKRVGDPVRKGDVLGLVEAPEVGKAKAEFLSAFRTLELRSQQLEQQRRIAASLPERQLRETEAAVAEARIREFNAQQALINLGLPVYANELANLPDEQLTRRVRFLGLPESVVNKLDGDTTTANLVPLFAPFDGVVTRSDMVAGEMVTSAQPQFVVADVRRVWVTLDVRQEDMAPVRKGQRLTFRPDGSAEGDTAAGVVSWISTEVDDKTRTVRVRADVANPDGRLRARSFGSGQILVTEPHEAVTVPSDAVQWGGPYPVVFVRGGDGLTFEARTVRVGVRNREATEITEGVRPGDVVVTTGSHVLWSAIFQSEAEEEEKK